MSQPKAIRSLDELFGEYDAFFCDVWGVVHDGERKSPAAEAALIAAREAGIAVVLVTNSPRLSAGVIAQLDALEVSRQAYDSIVTSGDATRKLIERAPAAVFHIGPERDRDIFDGLSTRFVSAHEAEVAVATGLFDDESETAEDYHSMLGTLAERGVEMICANPDIVVHRGDRLIHCAGALGQAYERIGGTVHLAGKPHAPIYQTARERLAERPASRILCIGDGLFTDVAGAKAAGADALFIQEGIHRDELEATRGDTELLGAELGRRGVAARFVMPALRR